MAGYKKLPSCETVEALVEQGLTNRQIGERYGVSAEGVRQARIRCGIPATSTRMNHQGFIPWRVRGHHTTGYFAKMLRAYSRRVQQMPLDPQVAGQLDAWLEYMDGKNPHGIPLSVHYDRLDPEGFWVEARVSGDHDYIHPPNERVG